MILRRSLVLARCRHRSSTADRAHEAPCACPAKVRSSSTAGPASLRPFPSCRSSLVTAALATARSFVPHDPKITGRCVPCRAVRRSVSAPSSGWAGGSPSGRCSVPARSGCPVRMGRTRSVTGRSLQSALPRGRARSGHSAPASGTPRGIPRRPNRFGFRLWRSAVLLPLPPSRGGGWRAPPRSSEISRTARPSVLWRSPRGACRGTVHSSFDGASVRGGPLVPVRYRRSLTVLAPRLALRRPAPGSFSIDEFSGIRSYVATSGFTVPSLGFVPLRGFRPDPVTVALARCRRRSPVSR